MALVIFSVLLALVTAQGAGAEWWSANFNQTTTATGTGVNTGVFKFNWPARTFSITFSSGWTETYTYDTARGYPPRPIPSLQTRFSQGPASCLPSCGAASIIDAMPPLAPSLGSAYLDTVGSTGCITYIPNKATASQFITSFTASGSGASTLICSITLKDGRVFKLDNTTFQWGNVAIPAPTGCVCDNQMDIWILVDHSSSISDSKMVQFKSFVQTFLAKLAISPNGINVGMSWFHYKTGINFNITGNMANINAAMNQWWTNCSAAASQCASNPTLLGCLGCQAPATATSSAIRGYSGATTSPNWPAGSANVVGALSSFYDPVYGGSVRNVPKMFLTLTDGAVNHLLNQNGGVGGCQFGTCSPDLTAAVSALRNKHAASFPATTTLTTIAMGIGQPGTDPNLSLSPEHLLILAEGVAANTFTAPSFDALAASLDQLLLLSCPASNDIVQNACLQSCCGLCVCGVCKPPTMCVDDNICTNQVMNTCCNTVPELITKSCPTPNRCTIATCDPQGVTGGTCRYTPVDCSSFANGCTKYNCTASTGLCTTADISACPPTDCTWGPWTQWSACSRTCANGTIARSRSTNQSATNGGAACVGNSSETLGCNAGCCPVNCVQTQWTTWTTCASCGVGNQTRTRTTTTVDSCNGVTCGALAESRFCPACINRDCSGYNSSTCNCSTTTATLTFYISTTQSGNGRNCTFPAGTQFTQPCTASQISRCPVPCNESWTAWTACDCNYHTQNRSHFYYAPPRNGGTPCTFTTNFSNRQSCVPLASQNCPLYGPLCNDVTDCRDNFACTLDQCILQPDGLKHCDWLTPVNCSVNLCLSSNTCDETRGCVPTIKPIATACPTNRCNIATCDQTLNAGAGGCVLTPVNCTSFTQGCITYSCSLSTGSCSVQNTSLCPPVPCTWSDWTQWGGCSRTCGNGTSTRTRFVNQTAKYGGAACTGVNSESLVCNTDCCPVNCAYSNWATWTACALCSTDNRTRARTITRTDSCGGVACGTLNETQQCPPCTPQNCTGVNTTGSCACIADGSTGTTIQTYSVTKPQVGNGTACPFPDGTTWNVTCTPAQIALCPRPCVETMTNWSTCNCYTFQQMKSYIINSPAANGGTQCSYPAAFNQTQDCVPVTNCSYLGPTCVFNEDCNDEVACTLDACVLMAEDGGYHCTWTGRLNCNSTNICESGYCDNTVGCRRTNLTAAVACPTGNPCNLSVCDNSGNGGNGSCVYTPKDCSAFSDGCQKYQCDPATGQCSVPDRSTCPPVPCTYGDWGAWTACPVTCGLGNQSRTRAINQTSMDGGANCSGITSDTQTCNAGCCPVDCVMTQWTTWSTAACTLCGTENQTRTRNITTPDSCNGVVCGPVFDDNMKCPPCAPVDCVGANTTSPCNCSADGFAGTHVVTYYISVAKIGTGAACPFADATNWTENCSPLEINGCPKPCIDTWTNWSICDCFNNSQSRDFIIVQNPTNGGLPCQFPAPFTAHQGCTPDASQNCPNLGPLCVTAADCNDGKACTVDKCLFYSPPGSYHCDWSEPVVCNDSSVCTSDVCDDLKGCVYSQVLFCADNNACTNDMCDNVTGCQYSNVTCPDYDICNLGQCDTVLGCGVQQRDCSLNVTVDNCTSVYCDVNYTRHGKASACVTTNLCVGSVAALAIGLSAGIIAGIIVAAILALAICGGGTVAMATQIHAVNENAVIMNPLYQGTQTNADNPLFHRGAGSEECV